ncbi:hypothetical protein [Solirubrobacter soli]|uniref:hypothetical protein n=1 Tax=Solirubrobacter soli TaxID=363832 RepID=UPI00040476FF|nr:hypothetical protein [Solirubrobacter soli]
MNVTRIATIALVATALTAPAASARPIEQTPAAAVSHHHHQDRRSPDAIDAAEPHQDLRSPDAIDAAAAQPATPLQTSSEPDVAWAAIGIGGSLLALGILAGTAGRMRRRHARTPA